MYGMTTLDYAKALGEAHREELTSAMRARPSPTDDWRTRLGRSLVRTGLRLIDQPDRPASSARAVGA